MSGLQLAVSLYLIPGSCYQYLHKITGKPLGIKVTREGLGKNTIKFRALEREQGPGNLTGCEPATRGSDSPGLQKASNEKTSLKAKRAAFAQRNE